ncbi:MAG: metalloregulator ArsR/SmtB family transcription factor [Acidimicrobiales bacterium]|nr:metalloregulator ArsR/SmtB family transcription factor [Acidimicrobiales bacterium]
MATAVSTPPGSLEALADPVRWQLLGELGRSDRRVGELVRLVDRPQNLVSYHLRALRDAGLVTARRSAYDGRDTYYRVDLDRCADLLRVAGEALHPGVRLTPAAPRLPTTDPRRRVLFLCTGNSARSQMAEALLAHVAGGTVEARSAGSHPKPLHLNAVRVMAARGIDISTHRTKAVDEVADRRFDVVVTLCDKVREVCPELPGAPVAAHWSMGDPAAEGDTDEATLAAFERTVSELEVRIPHLLAALAALGLPAADAPDPAHRRPPRDQPGKR